MDWVSNRSQDTIIIQLLNIHASIGILLVYFFLLWIVSAPRNNPHPTNQPSIHKFVSSCAPDGRTINFTVLHRWCLCTHFVESLRNICHTKLAFFSLPLASLDNDDRRGCFCKQWLVRMYYFRVQKISRFSSNNDFLARTWSIRDETVDSEPTTKWSGIFHGNGQQQHAIT